MAYKDLQQQGKQWKKLCDCPAKYQQTCVWPDDFKRGRIEKLSRVILNIDYEVAIASTQIGFEVTPVFTISFVRVQQRKTPS